MRIKHSQTLWGIIFALPWMLGFIVFYLYPIVTSLFFSLTDYSMSDHFAWVGLDNYFQLLQDEVFIQSLKNTLVYVIGLVPVGLFIGMGLALLLAKPLREKVLYRSIIYMPGIVPIFALAAIAQWFFNPYIGFINVNVERLGLEAPAWLTDENWVKLTIILISQLGVGGTAVIYLAALNDIPQELYEAAELDGVTGWSRFWRITFPLLGPATFYYMIMSTIGALQIFDLPQILTEGGPAHASLSYVQYLYKQAFTYSRMGYASAMAWLLFILGMGLTWLIFKLPISGWHYDETQ